MIKWINRLGDYITDRILTNGNGHYHICECEDTWENLKKEISIVRKEGQRLIGESEKIKRVQ